MDDPLGVARLLQITGRHIHRPIPVPFGTIPVSLISDDGRAPLPSSRHSSPVPEQIQASIRLVTACSCAPRPVTIGRGRGRVPTLVPFNLPVGSGRARTHCRVCQLPPSRQPRVSTDHPCLEPVVLPTYEQMLQRPMVPDTPPPPYEEFYEKPRFLSFDFSAAGIRRTIVWPTTACADTTTVTYFAPPLEDDEDESDE